LRRCCSMRVVEVVGREEVRGGVAGQDFVDEGAALQAVRGFFRVGGAGASRPMMLR